MIIQLAASAALIAVHDVATKSYSANATPHPSDIIWSQNVLVNCGIRAQEPYVAEEAEEREEVEEGGARKQAVPVKVVI